jgi:UDPglucose 6-dehydrogenase
MKIGIVGNGYVGSAVASSYPDSRIMISDPKYPDISVDISSLKKNCAAIFVCVPTPQSATGECDTSILEGVLKELKGFKGIVIAKSTASPTVYRRLEKESKLKLAHVPEFLTQARAKYDYVNPHKILVGCKKKLRDQVTEVLMNSAVNFDRINIEYCSIEEASYFKYMANCMLAMKVIVNNELYDLAKRLKLDWDTLTGIAKTDYRLGATHWAVPGPDGERGYGGACFPKDTAALKYIANQADVAVPMLSTAIDSNNQYRSK